MRGPGFNSLFRPSFLLVVVQTSDVLSHVVNKGTVQ